MVKKVITVCRIVCRIDLCNLIKLIQGHHLHSRELNCSRGCQGSRTRTGPPSASSTRTFSTKVMMRMRPTTSSFVHHRVGFSCVLAVGEPWGGRKEALRALRVRKEPGSKASSLRSEESTDLFELCTFLHLTIIAIKNIFKNPSPPQQNYRWVHWEIPS